MRLNGVWSEPGTLIGRHQRTGALLSAIDNDNGGLIVRKSTQLEISMLGMQEPLSIAEHKAIPLRESVYGPIRMYGPRPEERPPLVKQPSYLEDLQNQKKIKLARRRAARKVDLLMKQRKQWGV